MDMEVHVSYDVVNMASMLTSYSLIGIGGRIPLIREDDVPYLFRNVVRS